MPTLARGATVEDGGVVWRRRTHIRFIPFDGPCLLNGALLTTVAAGDPKVAATAQRLFCGV
jgi:hypothetical protein